MSDYKEWHKNFNKYIETLQSDERRFVKFEDRKKESVMTLESFKTMCKGKYKTTWRGVELVKSPEDLIILQQLLWDLKPVTIFEIGAYAGGSALWMSDTMKMYGSKTHIYSLDIDLSLVSHLARKGENISFIECNARDVEKAFPEHLLKACPHPWLLLEDAHLHTKVILEYFDNFFAPGDYVCVEDGTLYSPNDMGMGLREDKEFEPWGDVKLVTMKEFISKHPDRYLVDTYYNDFFGYNATSHWNGIWKRV